MRKSRLFLSAGIALAAITVSVPVSATTYVFQLSGSRDAQFSIDTATTPDYQSSSFIGDQVSYNNVAGSFGGVTGAATVGFGTFLAATLNILGSPQGFTQFAGPDLFSLVNNAPVFNTGTFTLNSIVSGQSSLTISVAPAASVPEPATWAMFIGGFGLVGSAMRRKKAAVSFA
ncbi:PEPxxWA-CTERM sorting domain-containing protein [Sphingomonas nostoxanthinifaciens]|nr:PEPxxWA-CTERM sorting domain-containing protein [Sphingomonas nostoxanthinifaciens]UAK25065.1 PEPxxWA-CTERM sorting domain-containing protein [Sphingomonas nostoxanthinifaciens]